VGSDPQEMLLMPHDGVEVRPSISKLLNKLTVSRIVELSNLSKGGLRCLTKSKTGR
jgi:hypothetical protein